MSDQRTGVPCSRLDPMNTLDAGRGSCEGLCAISLRWERNLVGSHLVRFRFFGRFEDDEPLVDLCDQLLSDGICELTG